MQKKIISLIIFFIINSILSNDSSFLNILKHSSYKIFDFLSGTKKKKHIIGKIFGASLFSVYFLHKYEKYRKYIPGNGKQKITFNDEQKQQIDYDKNIQYIPGNKKQKITLNDEQKAQIDNDEQKAQIDYQKNRKYIQLLSCLDLIGHLEIITKDALDKFNQKKEFEICKQIKDLKNEMTKFIESGLTRDVTMSLFKFFCKENKYNLTETQLDDIIKDLISATRQKEIEKRNNLNDEKQAAMCPFCFRKYKSEYAYRNSNKVFLRVIQKISFDYCCHSQCDLCSFRYGECNIFDRKLAYFCLTCYERTSENFNYENCFLRGRRGYLYCDLENKQ